MFRLVGLFLSSFACSLILPFVRCKLIGLFVDYPFVRCIVCSLTRSFLCLDYFVRSFVRSHVRLLVRWLVGWFVHSFAHAFVCLFIGWFVCSLVRSFTRSYLCLDYLVRSFARSLARSFACSLVGWFVRSWLSIGSFIRPFFAPLVSFSYLFAMQSFS